MILSIMWQYIFDFCEITQNCIQQLEKLQKKTVRTQKFFLDPAVFLSYYLNLIR